MLDGGETRYEDKVIESQRRARVSRLLRGMFGWSGIIPMWALALFIDGSISVFGGVSYFVPLQPTAPALLIEALMPILGALLLGVFVGKLVPGRKRRPGRRTLFGTIGGLAGVVVGYIVVYGVVQDPGPGYLTVVAACAFLGAVGGAVLSR